MNIKKIALHAALTLATIYVANKALPLNVRKELGL
jgi:hypothetical protein